MSLPEPTACGNCGQPLTEPANTPTDQRQPCSNCGSSLRSFPRELTDSLTLVGGTADVSLITYPRALLTIARSLIDNGHFNIAIVTSHMACEVAAERAFDAAYAAKGLVKLGEAVDVLMNGHNLGNDKHRKLYNALTATNLEAEPFWQRFKTASTKRNGIVHSGEQANKTDAEAALQAATELVTHLKQI